MSKPKTPAEVAESGFDLDALRRTGDDILARMKSLRELLDARAAALEECRTALETYHGELRKETEHLTKHEQELCEQFETRETQLARRESTCGEKESTFAALAEQQTARSSELQKL